MKYRAFCGIFKKIKEKETVRMEQEEKWYNPQKMLSYNQFINLIIGGRGIGKTFSIKKHLLKKHLKTGKQFIYLRRNKSELDRIDKEKFFTTELLRQCFEGFEIIDMDASKIHTKIIFKATNTGRPENTMTISSTKIILNGKMVCYLKSLSTWVDLKGSEYDEVDDILFDELLIDTASRKYYLKNEVEAFLNFLYSVFRKRTGCHAYLLSNATNFNNPYFAFLRFYETDERRFYNLKNKRFLIEFPPNNPFETEEDQENPFYHLIKGSKVYDSMVDNEFQVINNQNIRKITGEKRRLFSFYLDGTFLTCYHTIEGFIYVAKGFDRNLSAYTIDLTEVENGLLYLERTSPISRQLKRNYLNNIIVYKDLETKNKFMEVIEYVS